MCGPSRAPTERDRYWLYQEAKLAKSGMTAKAYAAEQGLSLHAFYQARMRLRPLGLLEKGSARSSPKHGKALTKTATRPVAFSKVEIREPRPTSASPVSWPAAR